MTVCQKLILLSTNELKEYFKFLEAAKYKDKKVNNCTADCKFILQLFHLTNLLF